MKLKEGDKVTHRKLPMRRIYTVVNPDNGNGVYSVTLQDRDLRYVHNPETRILVDTVKSPLYNVLCREVS